MEQLAGMQLQTDALEHITLASPYVDFVDFEAS
jgi:hypothetical protein